jgi:hypothetical protein
MHCNIDTDEEGNQILDLKSLIEQDGEIAWKEGDTLSFKVKRGLTIMTNESFKKIPASRFKRDLTSISRKLQDTNHPLKRVLITLKNEPKFVSLAYEEQGLTKEFIADAIQAKKEIDSGELTEYKFNDQE